MELGKIIAFLVVILIAVGGYYYFTNQPSATDQNAQSDMTNKSDNITTNEVTTASTNCSDMDCFNVNFKACRQSTATIPIMGTPAMYYTILGPKSGLCEISIKYLVDPNPGVNWAGKEMTCLYNNSMDFENTATNINDQCSGELRDIMVNGA